MQKKMYFLIILGAVSLFIGMLLAMNSMKPMHFTVLAGLIVIVGTLFGVFGKLLQDQNSSKNTEVLLKNSDSLQTQIKNLNRDLAQRDGKLIELSAKNIELSEKNTELSIRLSEKAIDIYDINKKIKYPLPDFVEVSYQIFFKLDDKSQAKADSILAKVTLDDKAYDIISYELANKIFNTVTFIRIDFSKNFKVSKDSYTLSTPLLLSLSGSPLPLQSRITYNREKKTFLITFENLKLTRDNNKFDSALNSNVISNSIFDLEASSVILWQVLSENCQIIKIEDLVIRSKELSLTFRDLEKTANEKVFVCSNKLKL